MQRVNYDNTNDAKGHRSQRSMDAAAPPNAVRQPVHACKRACMRTLRVVVVTRQLVRLVRACRLTRARARHAMVGALDAQGPGMLVVLPAVCAVLCARSGPWADTNNTCFMNIITAWTFKFRF